MNDFLMNSLAADGIDGLHAEAARHRLARAAHSTELCEAAPVAWIEGGTRSWPAGNDHSVGQRVFGRSFTQGSRPN